MLLLLPPGAGLKLADDDDLGFLQMDPACTDANVPGALRLRGQLNQAALAGALRAVSSRHDALRTRIVLQPQPQQQQQQQQGGAQQALQVVAPPDQALVALVAEDAAALPAGHFTPHCSMCALLQ